MGREKKKQQQQLGDEQNSSCHKQWIVFTYFSPQIHTTTSLFKHTNLHIAFWTTNTIYKLFKTETPKNLNVYNNSGIYGITCATFHLNYVDQTGQSLKQLYSEHIIQLTWKYVLTSDNFLHLDTYFVAPAHEMYQYSLRMAPGWLKFVGVSNVNKGVLTYIYSAWVGFLHKNTYHCHLVTTQLQ